jgi:RNA polymerase sigma-70 factor (ECF subfamily)
MLARLQFEEVLQTKLDESDIVQQTLLEAHQSLGNFRGKTEQEIAAWLQQILARNMADEVRKYRRGKRDIRLEASLNASLNASTARLEKWLACDDATPSQYAMANERVVALAAALIKLPDDQRRAVELHHLQGLPSAAIAKLLDRSEIAVAGLLRRGLKRLRELMRETSSSEP